MKQTILSRIFNSTLSSARSLSSLNNRSESSSLVKHAIDRIKNEYGDVVSVEKKAKDLIRFGLNTNVGTTRSTLWYTGQDELNETYVAGNSNSIDTLSCSNAGSDQELIVEGHYYDNNIRIFTKQIVKQNGQSKVQLSRSLNRVTRAYHAGRTETNLIGETYIYEDTAISAGKPTDTEKIHLTLPSGENQSQKASTSLSSSDYWIVTGFSAGYAEKSGSNIADVRLEVRRKGEVYRPISKGLIIRTGDDSIRDFIPYIVIPKESDIRLTALASTSGQSINGDIFGFLAKIID